jgi:AraC-like DNA-binding protein
MDGHAASTYMCCETDETGTVIRISRRFGTYEGMPLHRSYELIVHTETKPITVTCGGRNWPERPRRGKTGLPGYWQYNRNASTVSLNVEEATAADKEVRIELLLQPTNGRRTTGQSSDPANTEAINRTNFDEMVIAALERGEPMAAERTIRAWWNAGQKGADANGEWRLHLLKGIMLVIRLAESRGWAASEVFGTNMDVIYNMSGISSSSQGVHLLLQFVRQFIQYNPDKPSEQTLHPAVRETLTLIDRELGGELALQSLADRVGFHPFHLSRIFKKETGYTYSEYVMQRRMNAAKKWIESGKKVYEAAALTGFKDVKYFSRAFRKYWGVPPKTIK